MTRYFTCPHCGADVPVNARSCPECGSDEQTGWSEAAKYVHLLPDVGDGEPFPSQTMTRSRMAVAAIAVLLLGTYLIVQGLAWGLLAIPFLALIGGIAYVFRQALSLSPHKLEKQLFRYLLQKARGDRQLVKRLVDYERRRHPDATRSQLLQQAIDRWNEDGRQS